MAHPSTRPAPRPRTFWLLSVGLVMLGCARASSTPKNSNPSADPTPERRAGSMAGPKSEAGLPREKRVEPGPREPGTLSVPGFLPAPLLAPGNVDEVTIPLRVFVLAHGAGGRGEHHCLFWEPVLPPDVVLVCPQGSLLRRGDPEGGAYFPDHLALRAELRALIGAMKERFSDGIEEGGWRFIGYSQGATMGALAIVGEISIFRDLVLIEGGGENWIMSRALAFKEGGGERVLLSCGTSGCARRGEASVVVLEQAGLWARHVHAPGVGHTYGGDVGRLVLETMMTWEKSP